MIRINLILSITLNSIKTSPKMAMWEPRTKVVGQKTLLKRNRINGKCISVFAAIPILYIVRQHKLSILRLLTAFEFYSVALVYELVILIYLWIHTLLRDTLELHYISHARRIGHFLAVSLSPSSEIMTKSVYKFTNIALIAASNSRKNGT